MDDADELLDVIAEGTGQDRAEVEEIVVDALMDDHSDSSPDGDDVRY